MATTHSLPLSPTLHLLYLFSTLASPQSSWKVVYLEKGQFHVPGDFKTVANYGLAGMLKFARASVYKIFWLYFLLISVEGFEGKLAVLILQTKKKSPLKKKSLKCLKLVRKYILLVPKKTAARLLLLSSLSCSLWFILRTCALNRKFGIDFSGWRLWK